MRRKPDFFTYLAAGATDDWGLELTTVGYHHAPPHTDYPPPGHPATHAFDWKKGRVLDEYQLIYIPTGAGRFDTRRGTTAITAGDLMLLFKGDWHRYRPSGSTGWESYWVGFRGAYIERYVRRRLFPRRESFCLGIESPEKLLLLFDQLIELSRSEAQPFKVVALGCLLQIIAYATAEDTPKPDAPPQSPLVSRSIACIRQQLFTQVDFRLLAASFNLSYSRFRMLFKAGTGLAPHQFLLAERIACARRLLRNPRADIKSVAYQAGFSSPSYFTRMFRKRTGRTPSAERNRRP